MLQFSTGKILYFAVCSGNPLAWDAQRFVYIISHIGIVSFFDYNIIMLFTRQSQHFKTQNTPLRHRVPFQSRSMKCFYFSREVTELGPIPINREKTKTLTVFFKPSTF